MSYTSTIITGPHTPANTQVFLESTAPELVRDLRDALSMFSTAISLDMDFDLATINFTHHGLLEQRHVSGILAACKALGATVRIDQRDENHQLVRMLYWNPAMKCQNMLARELLGIEAQAQQESIRKRCLELEPDRWRASQLVSAYCDMLLPRSEQDPTRYTDDLNENLELVGKVVDLLAAPTIAPLGLSLDQAHAQKLAAKERNVTPASLLFENLERRSLDT